MPLEPADLPPTVLAFLRERHLASLTTLRRDGSPHVVAVGFTYDADARLARVITSDGSVKVRNVDRGGPGGAPARVALCQVDGRRWLSVEGPCVVSRDPAVIADAERRYAARYRPPRVNPRRVALLISVERMLGHA